MHYPSFSKTNMRYRGPVETVKMNHASSQIHRDVSLLYEKLEKIESGITSFQGASQNGIAVDAVDGPIGDRLEKIRREMKSIKEQISYE